MKKPWDIFIYKEKQKEEKFELLETWEDDSNKDYETHSTSKDLWVHDDIKKNLMRIKDDFEVPKNADIIIREFKIYGKIDSFIVYVDGLVDKNILNEDVLKNLMSATKERDYDEKDIIDTLSHSVINVGNITKEKRFDIIEQKITRGFCALFIDNADMCILLEAVRYEKRSIQKPDNEKVIRGSKESFVEDLATNISIIRRLLKNKNLIAEIMYIGAENNIACAILYLENIINPEIPKELKKRMEKVKSEKILSMGMLEQRIEDSKWMFFPQTLNTERPDRVVSMLLEGKAAIIVEGSPSACIVPTTFFHLYHITEDNNLRWQYGTFIRILRLLGILMALFLPGLYIALVMYNQEMISSELLASIAGAREGVPFPTIIELVVMEIAFELIREASSRVPGTIGETLGIVGALILGQAAVQASLVSPIMIIVVAASGIASFVIPEYSLSLAIRIARFFFIIMGYIAGFYGISIGMFVMFAMVCSMKSFGVPFLAPVAPKLRKTQDIVMVKPIDNAKYRADEINTLKKKYK